MNLPLPPTYRSMLVHHETKGGSNMLLPSAVAREQTRWGGGPGQGITPIPCPTLRPRGGFKNDQRMQVSDVRAGKHRQTTSAVTHGLKPSGVDVATLDASGGRGSRAATGAVIATRTPTSGLQAAFDWRGDERSLKTP